MSELVESLRAAHINSQQRALGSDIFKDAADRIEELEAELRSEVKGRQDDNNEWRELHES